MQNKVFRAYGELVKSFLVCVPRVFKFQIVTKLLFSVLILPLFWSLTQWLMATKGMSSVSNSMLGKFIWSPQGFVFLVLAILLVVTGLLLELFGFIIISSQILFNQVESSYWELFKYNLRRLPQMLEFSGLMVLLYIMVLAPLSGVNLTLSFFKDLKIPNFVTSVIDQNWMYTLGYSALLLIMFIFCIRWIFTFHFMVIGGMKASKSMQASAKLVSRHAWKWLKVIVGTTLLNGLVLLMGFVLMVLVILAIGEYTDLSNTFARIAMAFVLIFKDLFIFALAFVVIPFEVHQLTMLFYEFVKDDVDFAYLAKVSPVIPEKSKRSPIDHMLDRRKTVVTVILAMMILISIPTGLSLNELLKLGNQIEVMAHRGGSLSDPENSLRGIANSIKNGAQWVEIDVQRTKDGAYVLNHDDTFKRVAGVNRRVSDMTLAEVENLGVKVPRLEQVLDACKGKIKVNIELKGHTADMQMMEDVVTLVYSKNMVDQVVLTSLDEQMIRNIEDKYPTFNTGFIFFLAFGQIAEIKADYLILEEGEASDDLVSEIHDAGKKVVVWTVNSEESMERFSKSDVDAIITDDVVAMKRHLLLQRKKDLKERLYDELFRLD